ncbi:hypothetical protein BHE74_00043324 [Ensete ventricosum]|nr:hypothetical protein BHE74_00043324 [Ensete ventricosum]
MANGTRLLWEQEWALWEDKRGGAAIERGRLECLSYSRRRRDKARERERMQRRRSTPAGISTLRWALTCAIGAIAVGALVAVHVFLLPSAAVPDAFKLPKASPPPPPPLFFFFWFPLLKGGFFTLLQT